MKTKMFEKITALIIAAAFLPNQMASAHIVPAVSGGLRPLSYAQRDKAPAPAVPVNIDPKIEKLINRAQESLLQQYLFKYGSLPEDHYLTVYAREQLRQALGAEAGEYAVIIAPRWNEINACAIGKTIIVSRQLLEFVRYPSELQAVLAHEAIHARRLHSILREQIKDKGSNDIAWMILSNVGIRRLHEYESDFRWMIEQFNERGINPLGLTVFLERLASHEEDNGGASRDLEHGGLEDRALNVESIFYLLDLKSLETDLGELPAEYGRALSVMPLEKQYGLGNTDTLREAIAALPTQGLQEGIEYVFADIHELEKSLADLQGRRSQLSAKMSAKKEEFGLEDRPKRKRDLKTQWRELKGRRDEVDKAMKSVNAQLGPLRASFQNLIDRVDAELFSETVWPEPKARAIARGLFYDMHCGMRYLLADESPNALLSERHAADNSYLKTVSDLREIVALIADARFTSLAAGNLTINPYFPYGFLPDKMCQTYVELSNLYNRPNRQKVKECVEFVVSIGVAIDNAMEIKGARRVDTPEFIHTQVRKILLKLPRRYKGIRAMAWAKVPQDSKASLRQYARFGNEPIVLAEKIDAVLMEKYNQPFTASDYQDVLTDLKYLVDKDRLDASGFVDLFNLITNWAPAQVSRLSKYFAPINNAETKNELKYRHAAFRLFEEGLRNFALTAEERDFLLVSGLVVIGYDSEAELAQRSDSSLGIICKEHSYEEGENAAFCFKEQGAEAEDVVIHALHPADERYMSQRFPEIDKQWFTQALSPAQIGQVYRVYNKTAYFKFLPRGASARKFLPNVLLTRMLAAHLAQYKKWDDIFTAIAALEKEGVPAEDIIAEDKEAFGLILARLWHSLPGRPTKKQINQIRTASRFAESPFLAMRLQEYYYEKAWPVYATFNERLLVLMPDEKDMDINLNRVNAFVENEAKTKEQLAAVREKLMSRIDCALTEGSEAVGAGAIADTVKGNPDAAQKLVASLLATARNDAALRDFVYESVAPVGDEILLPRMSNIATVGEDAPMWHWERIQANAQDADSVLHFAYTAGPLGKRALFRRMCANPIGLVSKPDRRAAFLNSLVKGIVAEPAQGNGQDSALRDIIDKVIVAAGGCKTWKPVYFSLSSAVSDRLAIPPEYPTPWPEVPSYKLDVDANIEESDLRRIEGSLGNKYKKINKILPEHEQRPWRYEKPLLVYAENTLQEKLRRAGVSKEDVSAEPLSPLSFVIDCTEKTGSLGVRFLQLTPQFMKLPDKSYQNEFNRVRDAVRGQSKAVAAAVVEREWPQLWDHIEAFEDYVGGGSMMTAYKVRPKDPNAPPEVIKVLNPNLQYFLETNSKFVDEVLTELERRFGRERYRAARMVFEKVKEWIRRDCNFGNFLEHDAEFRRQNHGFTVSGLNRRIYVPRSYGPASKFFIREEFVEGRNLTDWNELAAEGCDMKAVVSLILHNYIHQLQQGFVHSDVHEGNFRMMKNGDVAILDRNFFLRLNPAMRTLINDAVLDPVNLLSMDTNTLLDRIIAVCPGLTLTGAQRERLTAVNGPLAVFKNAVAEGNLSGINELLVALCDEGVDLPLEITLVFKNLNSMQQMAQRAGFDIMAAYLYPMEVTVSPKVVETPDGARDRMSESSVLRPLAYVQRPQDDEVALADQVMGRLVLKGRNDRGHVVFEGIAYIKAGSYVYSVRAVDVVNINVKGKVERRLRLEVQCYEGLNPHGFPYGQLWKRPRTDLHSGSLYPIGSDDGKCISNLPPRDIETSSEKARELDLKLANEHCQFAVNWDEKSGTTEIYIKNIGGDYVDQPSETVVIFKKPSGPFHHYTSPMSVDATLNGRVHRAAALSVLRPLAAVEKQTGRIPAATLKQIIDVMRAESAKIDSYIADAIDNLPKSAKKQRLSRSVMNRYRALFGKIATIGKGIPEFDNLARAIRLGDFSHMAVMENLAEILIDSGVCLVFGERPDYIKERYIDNLPELSLSVVAERRTIDLGLIGDEEKIAAIGLNESIAPSYSELEGAGVSEYKAACIPAVRIGGAMLVVYKRVAIIGELLDYYTIRACIADTGGLPEDAKTHNGVMDETLKALLIKQWPDMPSLSPGQFASREEYGEAKRKRSARFFKENYEGYLASVIVHEIIHTLFGATLDERMPTLMEIARTDYGWLRLYGLMRLLAGENDEGKSLTHVRALNFILHEMLPQMFEKIDPELIPDIPEPMRLAAAKTNPNEYPDELLQAIQRLPTNVLRGVALVVFNHLAGVPEAQSSAGSTAKPAGASEILSAV